MAVYNMEMKQFNGTDYDILLPHSYLADNATNANQLGGKTLSEVVNQSRNELCQIATGQYIGTGDYSEGTTVTIQTGFKPKLLFVFKSIGDVKPTATTNSQAYYNGALLHDWGGSTHAYGGVWWEGLEYAPVTASYDDNGGVESGVAVSFTADANSISWTSIKPNGVSSYRSNSNVANFLYNASDTYYYVAIGY